MRNENEKLLSTLIIILMILSLNACSNEKDLSKTNNDPASTQSTTSGKDDKNTKNIHNEDIEIDSILAVDTDECMIELSDINITDKDIKIKPLLENRTEYIHEMFSIADASINGIEYQPFYAADVSARKKKNDTISFNIKDINEYLDEITDIRITFKVYDYDNFLNDDYAYETIHIYPHGEDKATKFVREDKDTDLVIIDNEYIKAVIMSCQLPIT